MKYTFFQKVQIWFIGLLTKIHWNQTALLLEEDNIELKEKFTVDYYIIATRRSNYLTTFFINMGHFLLTGKWGYYNHVLMNLEDEVETDSDFRFIEATGRGTHYSTFDQVFSGVDAVALIKPKNISLDEWTEALDSIKVYLGVPYDNLFNLKNALEINCVELIHLALRNTKDYDINFAEFEKLVAKKEKITPQMFLDFSDFEVVYEIRRQ